MFRHRRPDQPAAGAAMCGFVLLCPAC